MGFVDDIAVLVARALVPIAELLEGSDADLLALVARLGWTLPAVPPSLRGARAAATALADALEDVEDARAGLGGPDSPLAALAAFAVAVGRIPDGLAVELPPDFVAHSGIAGEFTVRLFDLAVVRGLRRD